jgi:hypothetical protein
VPVLRLGGGGDDIFNLYLYRETLTRIIEIEEVLLTTQAENSGQIAMIVLYIQYC